MQAKKLFTGILAALLVFGVCLTGCEDGSIDNTKNGTDNNGNPFLGAWENTLYGIDLEFTPANFIWTEGKSGHDESSENYYMTGTYDVYDEGYSLMAVLTVMDSWGSGEIGFGSVTGNILHLTVIGEYGGESISINFTRKSGGSSDTGKTCTVRFNAGEGSGSPPANQTVSYGTPLTLPDQGNMNAPYGKYFAGWIDMDNIYYYPGSTIPVLTNMEFEALWESSYGSGKICTVTFSAGQGSGSPPYPQTVSEGSNIILPGQESMTAPGMVLNGWLSSLDYSNYSGGMWYTVWDDVTFTAQWTASGGGTPTAKTVTFNAGEGSGTAPSAQTVNNGAAITLPGQGSMTAPSGKTFSGWKSSLDNNVYSGEASYSVWDNVTFTAQWTASGGGAASYTVTFSKGQGSGTPPAPMTVTAGQSITLPGEGEIIPPTIVKSFYAWQTGGNNYTPGQTYTVNANTTFTAQFRVR